MIIIERYWQEPNPRGGCYNKLNKVERQCFADDDLNGVNSFINETSKVSGYEWTNVEYKYIKL